MMEIRKKAPIILTKEKSLVEMLKNAKYPFEPGMVITLPEDAILIEPQDEPKD